jgi:hypothetical protein
MGGRATIEWLLGGTLRCARPAATYQGGPQLLPARRLRSTLAVVVMRRLKACIFYLDPNVHDEGRSGMMLALALSPHDDDDSWLAAAHRQGDGMSV